MVAHEREGEKECVCEREEKGGGQTREGREGGRGMEGGREGRRVRGPEGGMEAHTNLLPSRSFFLSRALSLFLSLSFFLALYLTHIHTHISPLTWLQGMSVVYMYIMYVCKYKK